MIGIAQIKSINSKMSKIFGIIVAPLLFVMFGFCLAGQLYFPLNLICLGIAIMFLIIVIMKYLSMNIVEVEKLFALTSKAKLSYLKQVLKDHGITFLLSLLVILFLKFAWNPLLLYQFWTLNNIFLDYTGFLVYIPIGMSLEILPLRLRLKYYQKNLSQKQKKAAMDNHKYYQFIENLEKDDENYVIRMEIIKENNQIIRKANKFIWTTGISHSLWIEAFKIILLAIFSLL